MSSSNVSEACEIAVKAASVGVQNIMEKKLADWEARLADKETRLDQRERAVTDRERAVAERELALSRPASSSDPATSTGMRLPCDNCGSGICSRGGPCVVNGVEIHTHHHCRACHLMYRRTGCKGRGKQAA